MLHRGETTGEIKSNEMLFSDERGKPEYSGKDLSELRRDQQNQPTYRVDSGVDPAGHIAATRELSPLRQH